MPEVYLSIHEKPDSNPKNVVREYDRIPVVGEIVTDTGTEAFYEVIQVVHKTEVDHADKIKSKHVDVFVLRVNESSRERFGRLARERLKKG